MPRLPGVSQKDAVRVFQKLGYRIVRESGHLILSNGERRLESPAVPRVALKASSLPLLKRITPSGRFYVSYNLLIYLSGFIGEGRIHAATSDVSNKTE